MYGITPISMSSYGAVAEIDRGKTDQCCYRWRSKKLPFIRVLGMGRTLIMPLILLDYQCRPFAVPPTSPYNPSSLDQSKTNCLSILYREGSVKALSKGSYLEPWQNERQSEERRKRKAARYSFPFSHLVACPYVMGFLRAPAYSRSPIR